MITFDATTAERRNAKMPHELFTVNTVIVHLFLSLGLIKLFTIEMATSITVCILISICIIAYTFFRTKRAKHHDTYLVYLHWQLSLNRYKLLIPAYIFYFIITSLNFFITSDAPVSMDGSTILESILNLLGIVPMFFAVLISVVLGSGSLFNAGRAEVDKKLSLKYPNPKLP
jgi:hypothetical protein